MKQTIVIAKYRGQDNAVGIATRYGLDGLGFEIQAAREIFSSP
jgi:hypothetical protein